MHIHVLNLAPAILTIASACFVPLSNPPLGLTPVMSFEIPSWVSACGRRGAPGGSSEVETGQTRERIAVFTRTAFHCE